MISFILSILLLLFIIYKCKECKEQYKDTVGYNNSSVLSNKILSIYESETLEITSIFNELFKNSDCDFDTSTYLMHGTYIEFPFNNIIKKMISDYLKENVSKFKKDKIEINADINHMYWKNTGNDRLFIFNVNLLNNTRFMTRNIVVKILIKDIKNFMNDNDYKTDIPALTLVLSTNILCIKLDTDNYISEISSYTGFDKLEPQYYQIKNGLHLMSPFMTSSNDLIITDNMKIDFKNKLDINVENLKNKMNKV